MATAILDLKALLNADDPVFPQLLRDETRDATQFTQVLGLNNLRKHAETKNLVSPTRGELRLAIIGGPTLRPLADLIEHFTATQLDVKLDFFAGEFDSYTSEIMDPEGELYEFKPEVIFILPSESRCQYTGSLADPIDAQKAQADKVAEDLLELCKIAHDRSGAQIVVCNYPLPPYFDPGPLRSSSLASDYAFRKVVNMQLGLKRPSYTHICDVEFLANRLGTLRAVDQRTWFESKQPYSAEMMVQVAREVAQIAGSLKKASKKVIVLDLDNTLWGGVVGDDGLEGIEIGTTSPRGEAFRHFQSYLRSLSQRGILLTVCSKNDHDKAIEPFETHPEMVLRLADVVNFKANWEPKSENIRLIAQELNLGLDSFVFLDDNPAEIEIVRQFLPEVTCICVGTDPSTFAAQLQDARLFETSAITGEDLERVTQYKQEAQRNELAGKATDMDSYLQSLEMVATIQEFKSVDVPRISQLINKSNQFNLTTRRRTESEVCDVIANPGEVGFTVRLADKFGDHGLIAIVVGQSGGRRIRHRHLATSCRVLKRGVEQETLNEIIRQAAKHGCKTVKGIYIPTKKNGMVSTLYPTLGFHPCRRNPRHLPPRTRRIHPPPPPHQNHFDRKAQRIDAS